MAARRPGDWNEWIHAEFVCDVDPALLPLAVRAGALLAEHAGTARWDEASGDGPDAERFKRALPGVDEDDAVVRKGVLALLRSIGALGVPQEEVARVFGGLEVSGDTCHGRNPRGVVYMLMFSGPASTVPILGTLGATLIAEFGGRPCGFAFKRDRVRVRDMPVDKAAEELMEQGEHWWGLYPPVRFCNGGGVFCTAAGFEVFDPETVLRGDGGAVDRDRMFDTHHKHRPFADFIDGRMDVALPQGGGKLVRRALRLFDPRTRTGGPDWDLGAIRGGDVPFKAAFPRARLSPRGPVAKLAMALYAGACADVGGEDGGWSVNDPLDTRYLKVHVAENDRSIALLDPDGESFEPARMVFIGQVLIQTMGALSPITFGYGTVKHSGGGGAWCTGDDLGIADGAAWVEARVEALGLSDDVPVGHGRE